LHNAERKQNPTLNLANHVCLFSAPRTEKDNERNLFLGRRRRKITFYENLHNNVDNPVSGIMRNGSSNAAGK
jgi:hypothetical protein